MTDKEKFEDLVNSGMQSVDFVKLYDIQADGKKHRLLVRVDKAVDQQGNPFMCLNASMVFSAGLVMAAMIPFPTMVEAIKALELFEEEDANGIGRQLYKQARLELEAAISAQREHAVVYPINTPKKSKDLLN